MRYNGEREPDDDDEAEASIVREGEPDSGIGKSVWDLKIYSLAHALGVAAHQLSLRLPKYEIYETGSQLRRAAKSVSANVVEGYGRRRYQADYLRFLIFAKASLSGTEEHLHYIRDCHADLQTEVAALLTKADALGHKLHRFIALVESNHRA